MARPPTRRRDSHDPDATISTPATADASDAPRFTAVLIHVDASVRLFSGTIASATRYLVTSDGARKSPSKTMTAAAPVLTHRMKSLTPRDAFQCTCR